MRSFFMSSIGRKYLMGISGLGLVVFVMVHMLGNLLIFAGPETYNRYAHQLEQSWVLVFELGLASLFVLHIVLAFLLSVKNYFSRGMAYALTPQGKKKPSFTKEPCWLRGL